MLAKKKVAPDVVDSGEVARYSPGRVELSSKDRGWANLLVTRVVHDAQYLVSSPQPATPDHCLVMLDAGGLKGQLSYNQGRYRPCNLIKGDWIIGQAYENAIDLSGEILLDSEKEFATLVIHLSPKILAVVAEDMVGVDQDKIELKHQVNVRDPLMAQIADLFKNQLYREDRYGKVYAETASHLLAAHLLQNYCLNPGAMPEVKGRLGKRMARVLEYIQENLHEEISIESMANVAHMSPFYFIRCFKKQVGKTPYQFIVQRRMEKAKYLLRNTNKPVIEIASETGYGYACNFSNAFKHYTGMTPNRYRKLR